MPTMRLICASARRPWRVIGCWAVASAVALALVAMLLPGALTAEGQPTNDPQSREAARAIREAFPSRAERPATDVIVVRSTRYGVDAGAFRAVVERLVTASRTSAAVESVRSYLDRPAQRGLVSHDRHAALVELSMPTFDEDGIKAVIASVDAARRTGSFTVDITGERTRQHDLNELSQQDLRAGELGIGLPAALVVLLLVFGTVVAGVVPLVLGWASIIVGLGLVAVIANLTGLSVFVINMLTGMGLALGVDYSLFTLSRYREERRAGRQKDAAIAVTAMTASRAVVFSGLTFVVAMFGMFLVPSSIMRSLATGAITAGVVSVAASVTLLPAVLSVLGDRLERLRVPLVGRSAQRSVPAGRDAAIRRVLRRPRIALGVALALLLCATAPLVGMQVGTSGVTSLPADLHARQGYSALAHAFPTATATPVEVVVTQDRPGGGTAAALRRLRTRLARDSRFGPGTVQRSVDGRVTVVSAPVRGDAAGLDATTAVRDLRAHVVPALFAGTAAQVLVGGTTAEQVDYFDSVTAPAPGVIALVLGLTFLLLTVIFRAPVLAGLTVALNVLSVGAAYGVLVLVFQHGVARGLLGFSASATIEAWVPLFLFSVLFGLSMDYQVLLLSRVRERVQQGADTADAVRAGVTSTARVVTGAALIIVAVFAGFASGQLIMFQQMGFGVAAALLIDATVVRLLLLPAAMVLLGDRCWHLPSRLRWLPRLDVERAPDATLEAS